MPVLLPENNALMLFKMQVLSCLLSMFISFFQVPGVLANVLPSIPADGRKSRSSQTEQAQEQSGSFNYSELRVYPPHPGDG